MAEPTLPRPGVRILACPCARPVRQGDGGGEMSRWTEDDFVFAVAGVLLLVMAMAFILVAIWLEVTR